MFNQFEIDQKLILSKYEELKSRALSAAVGSGLLLALYQGTIYGAGLFDHSINIAVTLGLIFLVLLRIIHSFEKKLSPNKWLNVFTFLNAFTAMGWGLLMYSSVYLHDGDSKVLSFVAMTSGGLIASSAYSLSISKIDFYIFQVTVLTSLGFSFFQGAHFENMRYGALCMIVVFFLFIVRQRKVWSSFWHQQKVVNFELQNILDAFPGGITIIQDGIYKKVNRTVVEKYLFNPSKIIGKAVGVEAPDSEFVKCISEYVHKSNKDLKLHREIKIATIDGVKDHLLLAERISSNAKKVDIIIITLDISKQKQFQKEIEEQKATIEYNSKMAALGEMSSGLAHEINNPLSIIVARTIVVLKILESEKIDLPKIIESTKHVQATAYRIAKIIKGLRTFAREAENDPFIETNLYDVVSETLTFCEARFKSHDINLDLSILAKEMFITCRPTQISQVLLNALNNSHDALENLDGPRWIRIEIFDKGNFVEIAITDSGNGIPENIRSKIMSPFFTTKEVGKGTGLGLSISKGIIESHGGKMAFNFSCANTQLLITLPKKQNKTGGVIAV